MPDQHLDPAVAATYDQRVAERFDPAVLGATVDRLAEFAAHGRALEFAIGTGRVALPLAARGVEVHGIELSEPMLRQLRGKPEGDAIQVTTGDMTHALAPGRFSLVYLVFNTIGNLTSQAEQVACFRNAARHLVPGGRFVIEVGVPDPPSRHDPNRFEVFDVSDSHVGVDEYPDGTDQVLVSHHVHPGADQAPRISGRFRYVWPSELDLMAQLAGMALEHRWGDWDRSPFTNRSPAHVSVWRLDPT
ncbi:MAG: class I SAM-dependent methyltransferase [Ilumatobacteraceae bacterium]